MGTLKGGVGIIKLEKRPELNGLLGDITSYDAVQERYAVTLRGAGSNQPQVLSVKRKNLRLLVDEPKHVEDEECRQALLERSNRISAPQHILRRAKAMKLSDEANYYLCRHLRELPPEKAHRTHLLMIQEYYDAEIRTLPVHVNASFFRSLAPYFVFESHGQRYRQTTTSDIIDVVHHNFCAAGAGEEPFDATLMIKAVVFAMVRQGDSDAAMTVPLNALWNAYCLINDDNFPGLVARAIDEEFRVAGIPDFNHKHLLWCICSLSVQLLKDLRVHNPANMEIRSHVSSVFIIVVSKSTFFFLHINCHLSSTRLVPIDKLSSLN
jgi:hypothetical protein